jgi:hypothetical protein
MNTLPVAHPMTITLKHPRTYQRRRRRRRFHGSLMVLSVWCVLTIYYHRHMLWRSYMDGDSDDNVHVNRTVLTTASDFDMSIVRDGVARDRTTTEDNRPERTSLDDDLESWEHHHKNATNHNVDEKLEDDDDKSKDDKEDDETTLEEGKDDEKGADDEDVSDTDTSLSTTDAPDTLSRASLLRRAWDKIFPKHEDVAREKSPAAQPDYEASYTNTTEAHSQRRQQTAPYLHRPPPLRIKVPYSEPPDSSVVEDKIKELMHEYPRDCSDKERYLRIILSSSDSYFRRSIGRDGLALCQALPTHQQVTRRYGDAPVIVGLETCAAYRELLKPEHNEGKQLEPMPRVAGLYHCGTNSLSRSFNENIRRLPRREFSPYEVPWGKHLPPARHRLNNTFPVTNSENRLRVLPIVIGMWKRTVECLKGVLLS